MSGAQAQRFAPISDPWPNAALPQLEVVAGKPGVWKLKPGSYKVRAVLEVVVQKSGGKAIFDDVFGDSLLQLPVPFEGNVSELVEQLTRLDIAAGKIGPDWVFVRIKSKTPVQYAAIAPSKPIKRVTFQFQFNMNRSAKPVDSKTLPPGAKPFDFNGEWVYQVPIR